MRFEGIRTDRAGLVKVLEFLESEQNSLNEPGREDEAKFGLEYINPFYKNPVGLTVREITGPAYVFSIETLGTYEPSSTDIQAVVNLLVDIHKGRSTTISVK